MPLPRERYDFEYMNHPYEDRSARVPGKKRAVDLGEPECRVRMETDHNHPEYGPFGPQSCDLPQGHIGRHEVHWDKDTLFASWAPRPE